MARKRSRLADYAVYFLVRGVVGVVQNLSWRRALSLARGHDPDAPPHLRKVTETL